MSLHWPQITWIVMMVISLMISARQHGNEKTGKHSLVTDSIAYVLSFVVLYFGGFFGGQ